MLFRQLWNRLRRKSENPNRQKDVFRDRFLREVIPKGGVAAELGVYKGTFSRHLLEVTQPKQLHLIDPWYMNGKEWAWAEGNKSTIDALKGVLHAHEKELISGLVVLHIGDDLKVLQQFPDHYFDWVYVDTSHQYDHTLKELTLLKVKVKASGIIAGDDWQSDPSHRHHGVYRALKEFTKYEPYKLIYGSEENHQWAIQRT